MTAELEALQQRLVRGYQEQLRHCDRAIAVADHGLGVKAEIWAGLIVWPTLITLAIGLLTIDQRPIPSTKPGQL